jgi:hypothetical protein
MESLTFGFWLFIIKPVCKSNRFEYGEPPMATIDDFDKLEEKVFQDYNQDGALVTVAGLRMLMVGMFIVIWPNARPLSNWLFVLAVILPVDWLVRSLWRRWITFPRLGYAKQLTHLESPPNARKKRGFWFQPLTFIPLFLSLQYSHPDLTIYTPTSSVFVATSLITLGYILGFRLYGIMSALSIGIVWLTVPIHINPGWAVVVIGFIQMGIGFSCLPRFLEKYPRLEESHAQ